MSKRPGRGNGGEREWSRCVTFALRRTPSLALLWRRQLRAVLGPATNAAMAIGRERDAAAIVYHASLLFGVRVSRAILQLGVRHSWESQILLRTMLEAWANVAWIRLAPAERAERFALFTAVERVYFLDSLVHEHRPLRFTVDWQRWMKQRERVANLFRKPSGKWAASWGGRISERLRDIARETQAGDLAFEYAWFSSCAHAGPVAMEQVASLAALSASARCQTAWQNARIVHQLAAASLLVMTGYIVEDLKLAAPSKLEALKARHLRLLALES